MSGTNRRRAGQLQRVRGISTTPTTATKSNRRRAGQRVVLSTKRGIPTTTTTATKAVWDNDANGGHRSVAEAGPIAGPVLKRDDRAQPARGDGALQPRRGRGRVGSDDRASWDDLDAGGARVSAGEAARVGAVDPTKTGSHRRVVKVYPTSMQGPGSGGGGDDNGGEPNAAVLDRPDPGPTLGAGKRRGSLVYRPHAVLSRYGSKKTQARCGMCRSPGDGDHVTGHCTGQIYCTATVVPTVWCERCYGMVYCSEQCRAADADRHGFRCRQYDCSRDIRANFGDVVWGQQDSRPPGYTRAQLRYISKQRGLIRGCLEYTLFFAVFLVMVLQYAQIEWAHRLDQSIDDAIISYDTEAGGAFTDIKTVEAWWDWTTNTYTKNVFNNVWYNNDERDERTLFTVGYVTPLVGGLRLMQTRSQANAGANCYGSPFDGLTGAMCYSAVKSTEDFGVDLAENLQQHSAATPIPGWNETSAGSNDSSTNSSTKSGGGGGMRRHRLRRREQTGANSTLSTSTGDNAATAGLDTHTLEAFKYKCASAWDSKYVAEMCGFYTDLPTFNANEGQPENPKAHLWRIGALKQLKWIDPQTREVHLYATFYTPSLKLWIYTDMAMHLGVSGEVTVNPNVKTIRIDVYNMNSEGNRARVALEIIFVTLVAYDLVRELLTVKRSWLYTRVVQGNIESVSMARILMSWAHIALQVATIALWVSYCQDPTRANLMSLTRDESSQFVDLSQLVKKDEVLRSVTMFNILFQCVRACRYFSIFPSGEVFVNILYRSIPPILGFLPIYVLCMLAFAIVGHIRFGSVREEWSTVESSFFRVYEVNYGLYDTDSLYEPGFDIMTKLYLYAMTATICIVMLNIILALMLASFDVVRQRHEATEFFPSESPMQFLTRTLLTCVLKRHTVRKFAAVLDGWENDDRHSDEPLVTYPLLKASVMRQYLADDADGILEPATLRGMEQMMDLLGPLRAHGSGSAAPAAQSKHDRGRSNHLAHPDNVA